MTIPHTRTSTRAWTRSAVWDFVRHYLEMVVAMVLGMVILGPLESALLTHLILRHTELPDEHVWSWSCWRRRRQYQARVSHYRRRGYPP